MDICTVKNAHVTDENYIPFLFVYMQIQAPQEIVLGREFVITPSGAFKEEAQCFYYIPLLSSLQALFYCEDISKQVFDHVHVRINTTNG